MSSFCRYLQLCSVLALACLLTACVPPQVLPPQAAQSTSAASSPTSVGTSTLTPSVAPTSTMTVAQVTHTEDPLRPAISPTLALSALTSPTPPSAAPNLVVATIITDDLPSGFQIGQSSLEYLGLLRPKMVVNSFGAERPDYGQGLAGVVAWLPSLKEGERLDCSLAEGSWLARLIETDRWQFERSTGLPELGDTMVGLTSRTGVDFITRAMHTDVVCWQHGDVGALVISSGLRGDEDALPIGDVARRLDDRIAWALSSDPTSRSYATPTPAPRLMPAPPPIRAPVAWSAELTPTLTLTDMPDGFEMVSKEMGASELTISEDSPYPGISTFSFLRGIFTSIHGFVVNLPDAEIQAGFDAALSHPNALFEEVTGYKLTVQPGVEPSYSVVVDLGDLARQVTMPLQESFFGPMSVDWVCLRRGGLGGCVFVESMYPKQGPYARALAGILEDRMRIYEAGRKTKLGNQ
jgi:hypothetical protein